MSDQTNQPSPDDVASAEQAARNAGLDYPTTSGDLDPAQQPQGDPELDQAMQSVEGVRSYLTADVDDTERLRRADAVEQAENTREGDNRKGVTDAVASARA